MVFEIRVDKNILIIASMYFNINQPIDIDLHKMQAILAHAKGGTIIFAIGTLDQPRGLTYWPTKEGIYWLIIRRLHIANEDSSCTTFGTCRGGSNIDLTVLNNQAMDFICEWAVHDQESSSDYIKNTVSVTGTSHSGRRGLTWQVRGTE